MYVGAGLLVGVTIILVGWVFCFCLFSVFLLGRAWSFSSPLLSSFKHGWAFETGWCSFFEPDWRCAFFGLVEFSLSPAGALPLSPAGALSSSPVGTYFRSFFESSCAPFSG